MGAAVAAGNRVGSELIYERRIFRLCRKKAEPVARANATVCHGSCFRTLRASRRRGSSVTLGKRVKPLPPSVKLALSIAGGLGVLLATYLAIVQVIGSRVDSRLRTGQVKEEIIREVSRYVIFDGNGTVVHDPNKVFDEWIESITVEKRSDYGAPEAWVRIKFKTVFDFGG